MAVQSQLYLFLSLKQVVILFWIGNNTSERAILNLIYSKISKRKGANDLEHHLHSSGDYL